MVNQYINPSKVYIKVKTVEKAVPGDKFQRAEKATQGIYTVLASRGIRLTGSAGSDVIFSTDSGKAVAVRQPLKL